MTDKMLDKLEPDPTIDPGFDIFDAHILMKELEAKHERIREIRDAAVEQERDEEIIVEAPESGESAKESTAERIAEALEGLITT